MNTKLINVAAKAWPAVTKYGPKMAFTAFVAAVGTLGEMKAAEKLAAMEKDLEILKETVEVLKTK